MVRSGPPAPPSPSVIRKIKNITAYKSAIKSITARLMIDRIRAIKLQALKRPLFLRSTMARMSAGIEVTAPQQKKERIASTKAVTAIPPAPSRPAGEVQP